MNKIQRLASSFSLKFIEDQGLEEFKKLNLLHCKDELTKTTNSLTPEEVNDVILHIGAIIIAVHNKDEVVIAALKAVDAIHAAKGN